MEHRQGMTDILLRFYSWVAAPQRRGERGDVPGWVMITVMTVGIVGGIWMVADEQLTQMLGNALRSVGKG
jgi:hypothetical protein